MNTRTVLLFSGGYDSLAAAHYLLQSDRLAATLFVGYGQPAAEMERGACRRAELGVPHYEVSAPLPHLAKMADDDGKPGPRVVPGRNTFLASLGVNVAVQVGAGRVALGCTADDAEAYPDCRRAWQKSLSQLLWVTYGVTLSLPWVSLSKRAVAAEARAYGWDMTEAWSCYTPWQGKPCGECNSCVERAALPDDEEEM